MIQPFSFSEYVQDISKLTLDIWMLKLYIDAEHQISWD